MSDESSALLVLEILLPVNMVPIMRLSCPHLAPRIQCWSCRSFFPKVRIFAPLEEMLPVRIRVQPFNNTPCQTTWNGPSSKKEKRTDAFQDKSSQLRTGEGQKFATPDRAFFSGARPPAPRFQCCCSVATFFFLSIPDFRAWRVANFCPGVRPSPT